MHVTTRSRTLSRLRCSPARSLHLLSPRRCRPRRWRNSSPMRAAIPASLNFGTPAGTLAHLTGELFRVRTGIDIVVIPYKGAATAVTDILGGQVDMTFEPTSVLVAHIQDAKVRPLAVTAAVRSPQLPDVPTMIESGLAGFTSYSWSGILAPAGTSPEIVDRLNAAI